MDPKLFVIPVERGCDPKGYLETVDSVLWVALGTIDIAEEMETLTNSKWIAFIQEGHDRLGYGFVCSVKLGALIQQPSQIIQTMRLAQCAVQRVRRCPTLLSPAAPLPPGDLAPDWHEIGTLIPGQTSA